MSARSSIEETLKKMREGFAAKRAAMSPEERAESDAYVERIVAERLAAARPEADDHLVLVRIALPRWQVIRWYMLASVKDWRAAIMADDRAVCTKPKINAACNAGSARTIKRADWTPRLLGHQINDLYKHTTIGEAMAAVTNARHIKRGNPRMIGFEYTGRRRQRDEALIRTGPDPGMPVGSRR